ncbi:hypothetical protein [Cetobacterium sp. 8H]|nr:hypothetical protein [Cetobacterium sp. 8H]
MVIVFLVLVLGIIYSIVENKKEEKKKKKKRKKDNIEYLKLKF